MFGNSFGLLLPIVGVMKHKFKRKIKTFKNLSCLTLIRVKLSIYTESNQNVLFSWMRVKVRIVSEFEVSKL
jgi:hypothetical protein